ncbi:LysR family transcriptional regulator [Pseudomonas sp.]|uniref:LysR family transcriptional regulator n=1 Tax=Pseudomonas sp. TaxID=306 RepID=UPI002733D629|nr:LysR family transcriptional regulator [Pseudomonas sp.]MDP3815594.1 LysR family transcriptional regulator [Pseudomonas sp.]
MDRFQEMQVFLAVAEAQSFAAAARRLNLSPPSVTRAVAALEERIGTLLLARTTRSVHITEAGQRYAEDCRRILAELEEAEESVAGSHASARGQLCLTAPVLFGELYVTPIVVDYLEQHPAVNIKALLVDRVVSMLDEGIDVAVRIGNLPDSGLHSVKVGEVRRVICAAPSYLAQQGRPQHPDDLREQRIVLSASSALVSDWQFAGPAGPIGVRLEPRLIVTANQAAINAASLGWGLTRVLSYQVASQVAAGELELVLEDFELPPLPIHVVYQGGRKVAAKVRTFVDFCAAQLGRDPALNPRRQA